MMLKIWFLNYANANFRRHLNNKSNTFDFRYKFWFWICWRCCKKLIILLYRSNFRISHMRVESKISISTKVDVDFEVFCLIICLIFNLIDSIRFLIRISTRISNSICFWAFFFSFLSFLDLFSFTFDSFSLLLDFLNQFAKEFVIRLLLDQNILMSSDMTFTAFNQFILISKEFSND